MKKISRITILAFSVFAVILSCNKEQNIPGDDIVSSGEEQPGVINPTNPVTISVSLPEDLATRVSFDPVINTTEGTDKGKITGMTLKWELTDKLLIADHANPSSTATFDCTSISEDGKKACFTGDLPSGTSFDISVEDGKSDSGFASISQPSDGVSNVKYWAAATDVAPEDLNNDFTLTHLSGVLAFTVKMPTSAIAAGIMSMEITASENIFYGGKNLTIRLDEAGDANNDGILYFFASLPAANCGSIAACSLLIHLNAPGTAHTIYTRYLELGAQTFTAGKVNNININATESDTHAGKTSDDGSSAHPYLIGDPYQVAAINGLATAGSTTYFKMIDDVDMTGVTHNSINTASGYTQSVNFNGNNKTISNLSKNFFYVFKGAVYDLTLDNSKVTARGILAEYCQGSGHTITNVDITSGSMATSSANGGALIGRINNGSGTTVTITDCDITNSTISGAAQTGGLIGSADATVVVENCTVSKSGSGTSSVTASGVNSGGLIGQTTGVVTITDCTVSSTDVTGTGVVGGVVGFANSQVTISGSKYTGGTVTSSGRYVGGFLGSTKDVASVISNCQVEEATINADYTADARGGGFVGQLQTSCLVKGCTVGTSSEKVTVASKEPTKTDNKYNVINVGGFVGVNYGTITKDGDARSKVYAKLTSNNTVGTPLDLGGFVGFGRGTIEYCDAVVDMTNLKGQYIGGFAGYVVNAGTVIDHCTINGTVTGNNYTGGFAGYVDSGDPTISNCTASGSVTAQSGCGGFVGQTMTGVFTNCSTSAICSFNGSNNGGFAGQIHGGSMTSCSATGNVTATGGTTYGGFVGLMPKTATLTDCSASGNVTAVGGNIGGFAGSINNDGTATIDHCHSSGNVINTTAAYNGGFIGVIVKGTAKITRCYASGNVTSDKSQVSAFIGSIHHETNTIDVTIQNCYATGNIINSNQVRGGLVGQIVKVTSVSISNCYTTGAVVGSFRLGGLIGDIREGNVTVEHCAAWNSSVTASSHGSGNWSSGAVVGTAFPKCTLKDNYRKPDISLLAFWGNATGYKWKLEDNYQHPNVDISNPLVICQISDGTLRPTTATGLGSGNDNYPQFAYNGKVEAGKTLSQLASTTLGWSADIWDFTGDLPTLK